MSDVAAPKDEQIKRLRSFSPGSRGKPRVDDRRVLSGIVFGNRNGLPRRDALGTYGQHKTLSDRRRRCGEAGTFTRILGRIAAAGAEPSTAMADATYLKAHRKGIEPAA